MGLPSQVAAGARRALAAHPGIGVAEGAATTLLHRVVPRGTAARNAGRPAAGAAARAALVLQRPPVVGRPGPRERTSCEAPRVGRLGGSGCFGSRPWAAILVAVVSTLALSACGSIGERGSTSATAAAAGGGSDDRASCPVTVATAGFVPPEPYPPEPPGGQVWYGTPELWTLLDAGPVIWGGRSYVHEGEIVLFSKTLWFSERFSTARGEDFSGDPNITLTATRLDEPAPVVRRDRGVPSFNEHIKNFLLVPLALPAEPGCWRVTATYHGAELSYVMEVGGRAFPGAGGPGGRSEGAAVG